VRADDSLALSRTLRFEIPRDDGLSMPAGLLRLATAIQVGDKHDVTIHDARRDPEGNRSLRTIASRVAPDLCVLWLHPATLEDGLEAARALRQSGGSIIVGTGPLVDLWPEGACRIPELDGLLPGHSVAGLLSALGVLEQNGSGKALIDALRAPKQLPPLREPLQRGLVDFAVYSRAADSLWPPLNADVVGRLQRLALPRSSGRAQPTVSSVLLHDSLGQPADPAQLIQELKACAALGIQWLDLRAVSGCSELDRSWFAQLFSELARYRAASLSSAHLRVPLTPVLFGELDVPRLRAAGVSAVDLGAVNGGDSAELGEAIAAARRCRQAGLFATGVLVLGRSGYDLEEDRQGVSTAIRASFPSTAGVDIRIATVDSARWANWLDAPGSEFHPPGLDSERLVLADRARLALQTTWKRGSGLRGSVEQFLRR